MEQIRIAAIGCGNRTRVYVGLSASHPEHFVTVAGADPLPERVDILASQYEWLLTATLRNLSGKPQEIAELADKKTGDG